MLIFRKIRKFFKTHVFEAFLHRNFKYASLMRILVRKIQIFNRKGSTIYCFFPWAQVRNRISTHAFYYIHFLAKLIAGIAKIKDFECFSAYLTMQSNRFSIKLSTFANNFTNEPRKNIIIMQFMARLACKDCTNFDSRNRNKWGF